MLSTAKSTKMPPCGARSADVEGHRQGTGDGAAGHDRRDDAQRVGGGERDGALGDEGGAEAQAALPFSRSGTVKSPGRTTVARASASGGHHAGEHDRGHDLELGGVAWPWRRRRGRRSRRL